MQRGFVPTDIKEFNLESQKLLRLAQQDILYLIDRGYPIKSASTFVGNHYLLSERQRLAIVRASAPSDILNQRLSKRISTDKKLDIVHIDGLNLIITLEVALSKSTLIKCMDGTIRDLAGLRGTYRLIDKTDVAIRLIGDALMKMGVQQVVFYLDAPVSNTGRLKARIMELLSEKPYQVTVEIVNSPDTILQRLDYVITSDAIILNQCKSWINLAVDIIGQNIPNVDCVDLSFSLQK